MSNGKDKLIFPLSKRSSRSVAFQFFLKSAEVGCWKMQPWVTAVLSGHCNSEINVCGLLFGVFSSLICGGEEWGEVEGRNI